MMMSQTANRDQILVVDDSINTLEVLQRNLLTQGYRVFTAASVAEALKLMESIEIDLVITDLKMPGASGMDLVKYVRENLKSTEVIMITGYASIESAVQAVKTGAEAYLAKPFTDEELLAAVRQALAKVTLGKETQRAADEGVEELQGLIGKSQVMKKIFATIRKAAPIGATVLITGESGTGKELVARAVHYLSPRATAPFVPVNCGSIPESLLESELFGFVKGAFTGAFETRKGFFQTADGGSIFLDEISNTSAAMQAKLLRVLEEQKVYRIGSDLPRNINVRILAATNKDLHAMVRSGLFREDLFYRLNVIAIRMPALREHPDDILLLTRHFIQKFARLFDKTLPEFTHPALEALKRYHWPGNVRELENTIQQLMAMNEATVIDISDLPPPMRFTLGHEKHLERTLSEVAAEHIRNVLAYVNGNKSRAAQILGIDRKTLRKKVPGKANGEK